MQTLTVWQFAGEILKSLPWYVWAIAITGTVLTIKDTIKWVYGRKKEKRLVTGEKGIVIRPQEKSLDGILPIYSHQGLPEDRKQPRTGKLRYVWKTLSVKRNWRAPSWSLHRGSGE